MASTVRSYGGEGAAAKSSASFKASGALSTGDAFSGEICDVNGDAERQKQKGELTGMSFADSMVACNVLVADKRGFLRPAIGRELGANNGVSWLVTYWCGKKIVNSDEIVVHDSIVIDLAVSVAVETGVVKWRGSPAGSRKCVQEPSVPRPMQATSHSDSVLGCFIGGASVSSDAIDDARDTRLPLSSDKLLFGKHRCPVFTMS